MTESEYFVCINCGGSLEVDDAPEGRPIKNRLSCPWCGGCMVKCPNWDIAYDLRKEAKSRILAEAGVKAILEKIDKIIVDIKAAAEERGAKE